MTQLLTPRLRLEPFAPEHLDGLQAMNRQLEVMRYISGRPETREETLASIERVQARWADWGYSWWSFFARENGRLVGAGCIQHLDRDSAQAHEIGWRLQPDCWGKGLASEAAEHMAAFAFEHLKAPLLCAICHPDNQASARVMQRLGMGYRGLETWYDKEWSTYAMTAEQWAASGRQVELQILGQRPPTK
ncbi:GNAT family N-acetyltransferase [Pelomonas sp. SE-A7]|uniref:GNAT family N-acetyltransferase n=1 Tax=Pelomonas sp. SE-A7 TaxID=3054953 RepID=UPI00259CE342|nr:GNAT family N-acetyltransferase [Pelomonas sp. SE-A7]MDM4765156.1 GNAT family N-acetyltransferase [Pelomonas sp. SE-A7]